MKKIGQYSLFFATIFLIAEGLWGSQFAPKNLTGQFIWVHYRGLLVLTLLFAGNYFCTLCPFVFLRNGFRLFISPKKIYPKILSNKWTALFLFSFMLFSYEYFSLWGRPKLTALVIIAYFLVALIVDIVFKNASFCKYLCPIGQFNFLSSTLSPREVKAIDQSVCHTCTTYECLKGNKSRNKNSTVPLRGCETQLFIPKKVGNLDCTFCMDCISACPYQNVAVLKVVPGMELALEEHRSGIGLLTDKRDWLALICVFTFGGLLNAFMMVDQRYELARFLSRIVSFQSEFVMTLIFFIAVLLPPLLLCLWLPKKFLRLIPTLIPLGFSIWLSHYSFHFLTGVFSFIPLLFHYQIPISLMGVPLSIVVPIQMGILCFGLFASIVLTIKNQASKESKFFYSFIHGFVFFLAIWTMSQSMEMRGTFIGVSP